IFCPDTAPGDRVRMRVRKRKRRHAEAELVEVLDAGPARVDPPCPYVPRCGGCRLQHLDYELTLEAKRRQIAEHLIRIGGLARVDVRPTEPAVSQFGYRNKMEYSAFDSEDGVCLGFHERGRWDRMVGLDACLLATPLGNAARDTVAAWARREALNGWDRREHTGQLRHVVIREGIATDELLVTIVSSSGCDGAVDRLADTLSTAHPQLVGLLHSVSDGVAETTADLPTRVVWGSSRFRERVRGVTLELSAEAFFQTNTLMTEPLYEHVARAAQLDGTQVVYDLFAGVGSIGICLAEGAREIVAIEIAAAAVEDARRNAAANGVGNHTAIAGDVRVVLRERGTEFPPPDVVVVDPPRAGLSGGACRRVLEAVPPVLVYVSCQPATFADNAKRFVDGGYRLEYVQPVDMFPQTPHVEAVARFVRSG
ncbi:MAG: 23S rRNA (uracil(1939)-C(5))-methyltransferase RlmD, partial [Thermoleophilia bacterium]|nr:23S rRNA (uracil(1939)-C(5))-methyltransferase RlmD [Thermoleophilia bacterium]